MDNLDNSNYELRTMKASDISARHDNYNPHNYSHSRERIENMMDQRRERLKQSDSKSASYLGRSREQQFNASFQPEHSFGPQKEDAKIAQFEPKAKYDYKPDLTEYRPLRHPYPNHGQNSDLRTDNTSEAFNYSIPKDEIYSRRP